MKIRSHSESHLVELDDGSRWQIFPGDLDVTLGREPDTDLRVIRIKGELCSHALVCVNNNGRVRVLPGGKPWPVGEVKKILKDS
jgi:hypothetical protein